MLLKRLGFIVVGLTLLTTSLFAGEVEEANLKAFLQAYFKGDVAELDRTLAATSEGVDRALMEQLLTGGLQAEVIWTTPAATVGYARTTAGVVYLFAWSNDLKRKATLKEVVSEVLDDQLALLASGGELQRWKLTRQRLVGGLIRVKRGDSPWTNLREASALPPSGDLVELDDKVVAVRIAPAPILTSLNSRARSSY